jgi:hypothetical protein
MWRERAFRYALCEYKDCWIPLRIAPWIDTTYHVRATSTTKIPPTREARMMENQWKCFSQVRIFIMG